jgi:hypothetical protein
MIERPSRKELTKKLAVARKHLQNEDWQALSYDVLREDCEELGLCSQSEVYQALLSALEEVTVDDYIGSRPPKKGSRGCILNRELFEFCRHFEPLKRRIYFKFAVDEDQLFIVSFHRERK